MKLREVHIEEYEKEIKRIKFWVNEEYGSHIIWRSNGWEIFRIDKGYHAADWSLADVKRDNRSDVSKLAE